MVLLAIGLSQAALFLGWQYLAGEIAVLSRQASSFNLHRAVLACALQPAIPWADLARTGSGQSVEISLADQPVRLTRRAHLQQQLEDGRALYLGDCAAPGGYRVQAGWLRETAGNYRLTSVLPGVP